MHFITPFSPYGLNHNKYLLKITQKFQGALHSMKDFCRSYRIPYEQRLTIYKTVIRSQLEYGAQILFYQNQKLINQLEKLQSHALRSLLDIPDSVPDAAILFINDVLPIHNRFDELQLNMFVRLKQSKHTLCGKLVNQLLQTNHSLKTYSNSFFEPYHTSIRTTLNQYGSTFRKLLYPSDNIIDPVIAKNIIRLKIHNASQFHLLGQLSQFQTAYPILRSFYEYHDIDDLITHISDTSVGDLLDITTSELQHCRIHTPALASQYIPSDICKYARSIWKNLLYNLPYRHLLPNACHTCHENSQYPLLHTLFFCPSHASHQNFYFKQIAQTLHRATILDHPLHSAIKQITVHHYVPTLREIINILPYLLGTSTNSMYQLPTAVNNQLRAHLINLSALVQHRKYSIFPLQWCSINQHTVSLQDINQHKHLLLDKTHSSLTLCTRTSLNLPCSAHHSSPPYFGSANTRNNNPALQAKANKFVSDLCNKFSDHTLIWTDGSCLRKRYPIQSGCATVISYKNTIQYTSSLKLNTDSIATAELSGILHALLWLRYCNPPCTSEIHLMADSKYAIEICQNKCKVNRKHIPLLQQIRECIATIKHRHTITFHWIPGHTNNQLHGTCDKLAVAAALSSRFLIDPFSDMAYFTGASAPGWAWPQP